MNTKPFICPHCSTEIGPRYTLLPATDQLPPHDFLIKTWRGRVLRARVIATMQGAFSNEAGPEQWNFKISFSEAVDESGDVKLDTHGRHIIFPGGVHSIRVDSLAKGTDGKPSPSLTAFLGARVLELAERAEDAIEVRDLAEQTFVTERLLSPKEIKRVQDELMARVASLDEREAALAAKEQAGG